MLHVGRGVVAACVLVCSCYVCVFLPLPSESPPERYVGRLKGRLSCLLTCACVALARALYVICLFLCLSGVACPPVQPYRLRERESALCAVLLFERFCTDFRRLYSRPSRHGCSWDLSQPSGET